MAKPRRIYRFGKHEFTAKTKAAKFFSVLRKRYPLGGTITDPDDLAAVADLLQGHCESEDKIGGGVKRLFVDSAPWPFAHTTCFWIERLEGPPTDFGFDACIHRIGALNRKSLRRHIQPQIDAYYASRIQPGSTVFVSDHSGREFPIHVLHVDHVTPFEQIVLRFAETEGIDVETELLTVAKDATSEPTWRNSALVARFFEFHKLFPLRLVAASENLGDLRRAEKAGL